MKGSVKLPVFIDDARKYANTTQLRAKYLGASYEAEYCQWQTLHGLGSLMETASLIITPNAYLEGKLIASYPPDPIGDLSVTRATTATRVNSAGLVELVPYNLLQYSEQFNNAVWATYAAGTGVAPIITANSTTAPNGTLTADKVVLNAGASATPSDQSQLYQLYAVTSGKTYTLSFYAKGENGGEQIMVRHAGAGSYTKITLTNQWARYTLTETAPLDISVSVVFLIRRGLLEPINASATFYLWGAQLVEGSTAKDYQKTETRLNIPRLDYSNGTCPSILVEPQRTNLLTYSSSFDNAAWTTQTISVTSNSTTAPDGTLTADTLTPSGSILFDNRVYQPQSVTNGVVYTLSVWAKSSVSNAKLTLALRNYGGQVFDITDQWERYSVQVTAGLLGGNFNIYAGDVTPITGAVNSSNVVTIWGAQLEAGSYATSYIPTTSASVTRNADVISKTGISSLIGQTEGTLFVEFYNYANNSTIQGTPLAISNGGFYGNAVYFEQYLGSWYCAIWNGTSQQFLGNAGVLSEGYHKLAVAYKANDIAYYVDGNQIAVDTSATIPTCDRVDIGAIGTSTNPEQLGVKAAALWKTRLTNTQLAQLTTI